MSESGAKSGKPVLIVTVAAIVLIVGGLAYRQSKIRQEDRSNQAAVVAAADFLSHNVPGGLADGSVIVTEQHDYWGRPMSARFVLSNTFTEVTVTSKHRNFENARDDISATSRNYDIGQIVEEGGRRFTKGVVEGVVDGVKSVIGKDRDEHDD